MNFQDLVQRCLCGIRNGNQIPLHGEIAMKRNGASQTLIVFHAIEQRLHGFISFSSQRLYDGIEIERNASWLAPLTRIDFLQVLN